MTQSSVKRVSMADLGAKGFAAFVAKNEPVVVSDLAAAWPAQKSFAPAALAERFPEVRVSGMAWEGDRYEDTFGYTWLDDSLGAWIDRLSSKDSLTHAFVAFGLPALGPDALAEVGKLRAFTPGARGRLAIRSSPAGLARATAPPAPSSPKGPAAGPGGDCRLL